MVKKPVTNEEKLQKMSSQKMKKKVIIPQQQKQILVLMTINLFSLCSKVFKTDCVLWEKNLLSFIFLFFFVLTRYSPKVFRLDKLLIRERKGQGIKLQMRN